MAVQIDGRTFKRFWKGPLLELCKFSTDYVCDESIYIGPETPNEEPLDPYRVFYPDVISDDDTVTVVGGDIVRDIGGIETRTSLEKTLSDWLRRLEEDTLIVHCPKDKTDLVRIALAGIEGVRIG